MWNVELPDAEWYEPGDYRLPAVINEVCAQNLLAIDTETTGLIVYKDMPLFWSLAWGDRRVCMPISTLPYFKAAFDDPSKSWVFANAKFDMHMLANVGVHFSGACLDTQVMHGMLHEEEAHGLKDMAKQLLGWRWKDFFDQFKFQIKANGEKETVGDMLLRVQATDLNALVEYASNDAYGTLKIYNRLEQDLRDAYTYSLYPDEYSTLYDLFIKTEAPFTKVLWTYERNGVFVNREYLDGIDRPIKEELDFIERDINRIAGCVLNPRSPAQLRDYFFDKLKLTPMTFTKGGKSGVKEPSVDSGFLEKYAEEGVPLAKVLVRHRDITKTLGTVEGLKESMDPYGRIHTRFGQSNVRTGRLASSSPNLQNVKRPDEDEFRIRGAFQATKGKNTTLIVSDYEQLEMRLLACATVTRERPEGAKDMIDIFLSGRDIHMGNAALVFGPIYKKKHGWDMTYDDIVQAKKVDKKVKSGELPISAMTEQVHRALYARQAAKAIGFG